MRLNIVTTIYPNRVWKLLVRITFAERRTYCTRGVITVLMALRGEGGKTVCIVSRYVLFIWKRTKNRYRTWTPAAGPARRRCDWNRCRPTGRRASRRARGRPASLSPRPRRRRRTRRSWRLRPARLASCGPGRFSVDKKKKIINLRR